MLKRDTVIFLLSTVLMCLIFFSIVYFTGGFEQMAREQKNIRAFINRCSHRGGKIITFQKADVNKVCVGPDGRWLEYY